MLRCEDCEFFEWAADGSPVLRCDPFSTVKEPECLVKLQVAQLTRLTRMHQATADMHQRFAPMQEKLFRHMEREINEAEDADKWKLDCEDDEEDDMFGL